MSQMLPQFVTVQKDKKKTKNKNKPNNKTKMVKNDKIRSYKSNKKIMDCGEDFLF